MAKGDPVDTRMKNRHGNTISSSVKPSPAENVPGEFNAIRPSESRGEADGMSSLLQE